MKKITVTALVLTGLFILTSCSIQPQQGDGGMQYFFSGEIVEAETDYLLIEVNDIGNTGLSEGTTVEVSTDVVAADGCPEFVIGEYAKVLMAENAKDDTIGRLDALSIYEVDETGLVD